MLATQLAAAIGAARTPAVLDALAKATWSGLAIGQLTEDQAQDAAAAIEGRRGEFRRPPVRSSNLPYAGAGPDRERRKGTNFHPQGQTLFARARVQRPPDRAASLARRRHLAASGPMPPALAAKFTTGELAVLRIVADEVRDKGRCDRTYAELAARAGVGRTTARNAVRRAGRLGFLHIEERPRPGRKHLANVVQITSSEWRAWIDSRPARPKEPMPRSASSRALRPVQPIGVKKPSTTARRF
jgi:hypothetical protein